MGFHHFAFRASIIDGFKCYLQIFSYPRLVMVDALPITKASSNSEIRESKILIIITRAAKVD